MENKCCHHILNINNELKITCSSCGKTWSRNHIGQLVADDLTK